MVHDRSKILGVGRAGAGVAALCCFTPVLVVLACLVGLSALVGYPDIALLPAMVFFIGLAVYSLARSRVSAGHGRRSTERD